MGMETNHRIVEIRPVRRWRFAAGVMGLLAAFAAPQVSSQSNALRASAASETASKSAACKALPGFYWEIGDGNAKLAGGSLGLLAPKAKDVLPIYSASKWLYGAYVYQRRGGQLSAADLSFLTLSSGHTGSGQCLTNNTVSACRNSMGPFDPAAVDLFYYGPAHLQQHAVELGLGSKTRAQLATAVRSVLGTDISLSYLQAQVASGVQMSTAQYGLFLRKILGGKLLLSGGALGSDSVCTYTSATSDSGRMLCPKSLYSPTDATPYALNEAWTYSLAHWVESDPLVGDGAFSSPGYGGFYPWIDATRSYYGILARVEMKNTAANASVNCGRLIRKAWMTGVAQS